MVEFYRNWFEFFFLALVVFGVLVALSAPSAIISYIVIFLSGIFAGRLIYERKNVADKCYVMVGVYLSINQKQLEMPKPSGKVAGVHGLNALGCTCAGRFIKNASTTIQQ